MKDSWREVVLNELVDCLDGQRVPVKKEDREKIEGSYPYYGASGIIDYVEDYIFNEDLILLGEDGENVISRNLPLAFKITGKNWVNNHAHVLKPKRNNDIDFLVYLLESRDYSNIISGSAQPKINQQNLMKLVFNVPNNILQHKIANILSTADTILKKTEESIAKYQALKQGLKNDLFTRGIDVGTGQLRPSYKDDPELYKDSELGFVPKDWEVQALSELGEFKNGINKDKNSFGSGTLFVNISDAYSEQLELDKLGRVQVSEVEKANYKLEIDDIIFTRSSVKPSGVGYTTIFKGSKDTIVYSGFMIRYRIYDKQNCNGEYFNNYFRWSEFRRRLLCISTVSANTNVNQENLNRLLSIVPSIDEQILITKRLRKTDKKIHTEQQVLAKYRQLKAGLMQDLLSGKVGVEGLLNITKNI